MRKLNNKNKNLAPAYTINPTTTKANWTAPCTKIRRIAGGLIGFLSGLLGIGGSFIIVLSLSKISNFNHQTITSTTLAAVGFTALRSLISHMHTSVAYWNIAVPLSISAASVMIIVSAFINHKIPEPISKKSFALVCLIAALYLGIRSFL